jgi:hypothetical protein
MFAIVDARDYPRLSKHKWCAKKSDVNWYAVRGKWDGTRTKIIRMHREIMNCPKRKEVHHKNRKTLDNRRRNLKVTTKRKNLSLRERDEPAPF